ncbi:MAG: DNA polymerase IV [Candidatus Taylorbacteria bacterium]
MPILHIDGDAFFASCEVSLDVRLKGKPVVTGLERGIASALTYEAKARGITRGMRLFEMRKICPDVIILPSDYETYSILSERMYAIVRRFVPTVEEYSIDECFADLSELKLKKENIEAIVRKIKNTLQAELGMTFSLGVGETKVLAKAASKFKKPDGLTIITREESPKYLGAIPIEKIWGIGMATAISLWKHGVRTALDFTEMREEWVNEHMNKPYVEIWHELRGTSLYHVRDEKKTEYQSISKTRTFTPASGERAVLLSELSKNAENACIKVRRYNLKAKEISFFIKTKEFNYFSADASLEYPTNDPQKVMQSVERNFDQIWKPKNLYRTTGVVLRNLSFGNIIQTDFFGEHKKSADKSALYEKVDRLSRKFGKHVVFLASSMSAMRKQHGGERGVNAERKRSLFRGETERKRLGIPMMKEVL